MHFTVIQIIIMFLIVYVCLYSLIDRVMKCVEHCATASLTSFLQDHTDGSEKPESRQKWTM